ncbi:MAG: hypothetical protein J6O17_02910 [Eubacterium sp.]|nr:hypothetical protein [Eubacterium sp.]
MYKVISEGNDFVLKFPYDELTFDREKMVLEALQKCRFRAPRKVCELLYEGKRGIVMTYVQGLNIEETLLSKKIVREIVKTIYEFERKSSMNEKVMLDVSLIKNASIYCFESAMGTVAKWLNRDYQMIFARMLEFHYTNENGANLCSGLSSGIDFDVLFNSYEEYHGIRTSLKKTEGNELRIIKNEIDSKMPVMLFIVPRLCNWTDEKDYRIYFLVIGYDEEGVYGYDLHSDSNNIIYVRNEIITENYREQTDVAVFEVVTDQKKVDFNNVKDIIKPIYHNFTIFDEMKLFAHDFKAYFTDQVKYERINDFRQMDLLNRFADIVRSRKLFAETCYYISKKNDDEFAYYIGYCFDDIGEGWNKVWRLLAKAFILNKGGAMNSRGLSVIEQVANGIIEVADYEKEVIDNVFGECRIENKIIKSSGKMDEDNYQAVIDVDLRDVYNNKAFKDNSDISPNFTEQGEYFLYENIVDNRNIPFGNIDFHINEKMDNFICANQKVKIPKDSYQKIYIMGCAEWGSGSGLIKVCDSEKKDEMLLLEFQDWFFCKMKNSSTWRGKANDCENQTVDRGLFCLDFEVDSSKEISELIFPDIPNVHIFGIKLIK